MEQFSACREGLEDPRTGNAALHGLHGLLMIALCTVLSGGETAKDMAVSGVARGVDGRTENGDRRRLERGLVPRRRR